MPIELKLRDSARVALAISAAFPLSAYAVSAGHIDFAIGAVTALSTDGRTRPLSKGSDFAPGETISTGDGRCQMRFTDGAQVSLQPGTQYRIDEYRFNGKNDGEEKGFFSLIKGGFRTITGLVGKADKRAYKVTTSVATIGIRGTEFVVLDQNGVTVSTGEGSVEVCTSAGCIVLASGESAVVKDSSGTPLRVTNKGADTTSAKPSPPTVKIDYSKNDEGLAAITSALPSGPGYAMSMAGMRDGGESTFVRGHSSGTATFSNASELTKFVVDGGEGGSYSAKTIAGGFTDGLIGWGRWTLGHGVDVPSFGDHPLENTHYVVGKPTSSDDMTSLSLANKVGTYTLSGYTLPTSYQNSTGITTTGSSGITGSLSADFGSHSVDYNVNNISVGGATYGINGSASISGAQISGSGGSVSGGCCAGSARVEGFFVGANAVRAGLVYQFSDFGGTTKRISGAAVFTQQTQGTRPPVVY
ncbi:MAG: hypothetical protein FD157_3356 [Rhodocyclaceae bacterium]|nr:MAG: hypothetical protein FD157_3356 [Rhodocyclaceae bacterium]TND03531.1 MAG: hypothetical protein FD118_1350 [Rhodocyclaceae bacterium]